MIVASYKLEPAKYGLLAVLFPTWRVLRDPLPPFVGENEVIVISDRVRDAYPSKTIIFISRHADSQLDSFDGMIRFLKERGVSISSKQETRLKALDEDDFLERAKVALVLGKLPEVDKGEDHASVYDLFKILFDGFDGAFVTYRNCHLPHRVVFSSLLTMMLRTQSDQVGQSAGYMKALDKNKSKYPLFKAKVLDYIGSPMRERDFLSFLFALNNVKGAS